MSLWSDILGTTKTAFKIGKTNTATLDASSLSAARTFALPNIALKTITCVFDGQGTAPTAGTIRYLVCNASGTLIGWRIVGDVTGSAVVDVWKIAYGASLPTVANTIAASAKPTLSSAKINKDDTLTGWTTSVTADDILGFKVDSASTLTTVTIELKLAS